MSPCASSTTAAGHSRRGPFPSFDRIKPINDRHGHAVGDKVLACLQRDVDGPEPAHGPADRILRGIVEPIDIEGHRLEVGASLEFASFAGKAHDVEPLLREVDAAMFCAKMKSD